MENITQDLCWFRSQQTIHLILAI